MSKPTKLSKNASKKTLSEAVELAKELYSKVELWCMDEHRIGLKPVLRKVWAPTGQRPVIATYPRYEWLYLYAFVQPETGMTIWYILPEMKLKAFQVVLDNFASSLEAEHKHILLVMDNASWHTSPNLVLPQSIEAVYQPSYSPELQPAEHLGALSDELVTNRCLSDLDALEQRLSVQCERLMQDPERIRAHTLFHWWPKLKV